MSELVLENESPAVQTRHSAPTFRRADGVELIGRLEGTGFAETQWLVRANGQFVQLTPLLYQTLAQLDEPATREQVAEGLTASTEWRVTPEQAEALLERKLGGVGLVVEAGAESSIAASEASQSVQRSAFMVAAPRRLLGDAAIETVARFARYLFAPVVVVPAIVLAVAVHAWVFFGHGVANSVLAVIFQPILLVAALAISVIAALVHELGHASALRYGGGRARSIGVGVFLVYPAFFTDVSDSYRLGRAGRLRTDLGGIYFHALFNIALMALYAVTHVEFLLFCVFLITLEMVRQALPFVRLDGYWLVADLTGIPDPLSFATPFVRSQFKRLRGGPRLPALRPWVRRTFVAYLLVSVPLAIGLLVLLISRLPDLIELLVNSLLLQVARLESAAAGAAPVPLVVSLVQITIIGFEIAATVYLALRLAASGVRWLGRAAGGTPVARVRGLVVAGVAVAALVALWSPVVLRAADQNIAGMAIVGVNQRDHVDGPISYDRSPPAGGNHAPVWQNCGFYAAAVPSERAVHSLEHGAVWITYGPGLPGADVDKLRGLAGQSYVLVTPFAQNPSPVVATAWGRQLLLQNANDPRLDQFVRAFRAGPQAPERGQPCSGGSSATQ